MNKTIRLIDKLGNTGYGIINTGGDWNPLFVIYNNRIFEVIETPSIMTNYITYKENYTVTVVKDVTFAHEVS